MRAEPVEALEIAPFDRLRAHRAGSPEYLPTNLWSHHYERHQRPTGAAG
jgi:hypothetical protein